MPKPIRRLLGIIYYVSGFLTFVSMFPMALSGSSVYELIAHDITWAYHFIFVAMFVTVELFAFLFTGKLITPTFVNSFCFGIQEKE